MEHFEVASVFVYKYLANLLFVLRIQGYQVVPGI